MPRWAHRVDSAPSPSRFFAVAKKGGRYRCETSSTLSGIDLTSSINISEENCTQLYENCRRKLYACWSHHDLNTSSRRALKMRPINKQKLSQLFEKDVLMTFGSPFSVQKMANVWRLLECTYIQFWAKHYRKTPKILSGSLYKMVISDLAFSILAIKNQNSVIINECL